MNLKRMKLLRKKNRINVYFPNLLFVFCLMPFISFLYSRDNSVHECKMLKFHTICKEFCRYIDWICVINTCLFPSFNLKLFHLFLPPSRHLPIYRTHKTFNTNLCTISIVNCIISISLILFLVRFY